MSSFKLFLLGAPRLLRDGKAMAFDSRKHLALIAYLAITGCSHTREALVTLLWPELESNRGRAGLRRNLSVIKKALGNEWLVVDREIISSDPDANFWLDVTQFRTHLQAWQGHYHPEEDVCPSCLAALKEAVELYQGDFMAGFSLRDSASFDAWQFFQTESLRQELADALQQLVRGYRTQADFKSAIPYARRWLALDPQHEPAHRALIELYDRIGVMAKHMSEVGTRLGRAVDSYNKAIGSLETRVLVSARKFKALEAAGSSGEIASLQPIETMSRSPQAQELATASDSEPGDDTTV